MKDETDLLKSTVTEYRCVVNREGDKEMGEMDMERLVRSLADAHDWTDRGARAIVTLANDYGAFMLRNALALAISLNKEDGDLDF